MISEFQELLAEEVAEIWHKKLVHCRDDRWYPRASPYEDKLQSARFRSLGTLSPIKTSPSGSGVDQGMQGRRKVFKNSQELAVGILEAFASTIFVKKVEHHFMGSCSYAAMHPLMIGISAQQQVLRNGLQCPVCPQLAGCHDSGVSTKSSMESY